MVFKRGIAGVAAAAALALVAPVPAGALEITSLASLGDAADAVRVADFDGDGRDDFAMAADCEVVVLLRRSFTTNGMPPALNRLDGFADPCGASRGLLALGDVTGDGAVDIIDGAVDRPGVKLHASRGDGTFTAPASFPTAGAPQELVTGDLNGDGRADLIVRRKTAIDVALTTPGGFLPPTSYGTFDESFSLAVGRTDAGPTLDVVVGATVGGRYKLVRFNGNGDGTLAAGELTETLVAGAGLLAAPLRGGLGRDDLVSVGGGIQTMHTGADGAFTSGRARIDQSWDSVTAADFDGDGDLDVAAVGHRDHAAIVVHFNDGTGLFTTQRRVENPLMAPLTSVQATDFDSDGHKDVVAMAKGTLFVLRSWPEVSVAHAVDAFDTVPVGAQSGARTATFRNTGIRPVALGQATVTERRGRAVFSITSDGCSGRTLAVDETCSVTLGFRPTAADRFEGSINVDAPYGGATTDFVGTGVAVPVAVPTDKTAPTVTPKIAKQTLKTVLSRGLKVTTKCNETCTVKASLRLKGKQVAKGTATGGKTLTLKLSKAAKQTLKRAKSAKLTLRLTATDAAGNVRTTTKTITVRR